MNSEAYSRVNSAWKATCKVLFGEEIGELKEYEEWLSEYQRRLRNEKSSVSGEPVALSVQNYCGGARFMRFEEGDFNRKFEPLSINEIKDIDSIVSAISERTIYSGNIALGNSRFVEGSSDVHNSNYVLSSANITDSKYLSHVEMTRYSENVFGCNAMGESKYLIRCAELYQSSRCFEAFTVRMVSDCFYSYNLEACTDCMFSFNLKSSRHCIGNLEVGREMYLRQKGKLLGEILDELSRKKRAPGIVELMNRLSDASGEVKEAFAGIAATARYREDNIDISPMEDAFGNSTSVILGRRLKGLRDYEEWLERHVVPLTFCNSVVSGRRTAVVGYSVFDRFPRSRITTVEEAPLLASLRLTEKEAATISLSNAHKLLGRIGYSTADADLENHNLVDCFMIGYSTNCYRCRAVPYTKNSACSYWPQKSDHAFGCNSAHQSSFAINAYYSTRISRGFEVDLCRDCMDLYFSHNCEALQDGMFCFNVKNLRRAIGNAQYSPDEYRRFKAAILEQISDELEQTKSLKWDVYNIGCTGEK